MSYDVRGLEFHSTRMWDWTSVSRALQFMELNDFNLMVFHRVDMLDQLSGPEAFLPEAVIQRRGLVRLHTIENNQEYIRQVIRHCHDRGIRFMLEVKEISYPDQLLDVVPELRGDGVVCPRHPIWLDFLRAKVAEVAHEIPELDGIIVSTASRESKVTVAGVGCTCDRCQNQSLAEWHTELLTTMEEELTQANMEFVVRDFSYEPVHQDALKEALGSLSPSTVASIKVTPHDFYPTFPDNPLIREDLGRPIWLEYDAWGQYFGWGTIPCSVIDDIRLRLEFGRSHGATGVLVRMDLEVFTGTWALNTLNRLNLIAMGMLTAHVATTTDEIYARFAASPLETPLALGAQRVSGAQDIVQERSAETEPPAGSVRQVDVAWIRACLEPTWDIIEKAIYYRGHVFHDDSMFPYSVEKAHWTMDEKHSLPAWFPERSADLELTDENVEAVRADRREAQRLAADCLARVKSRSGGLGDDEYQQFVRAFELLVLFVDGFALVTDAWIEARLVVTAHSADERKLLAACDPLERYEAVLREFQETTRYPHYVYLLLDYRRIGSFLADARAIAAGLPGAAAGRARPTTATVPRRGV